MDSIVDFIRKAFSDILVEKRKDVIESLNKNGHPVPFEVDNSEYISTSITAFATNKEFKDDIIKFMLNSKKTQDNFKNFAAQPEKGGMVEVLNDKDFSYAATGNQNFTEFPIFKQCDFT